jgi:hypothetical protein
VRIDEVAAALADAFGGDGARRAEASAWLEQSWHGVLDLLAREPDSRRLLAGFRKQLESRGDEDEWAYWIALMLGVLHDEPFVALEPATRRGIAGRMSGVAENFQLQMLLMDAFPRGLRRRLSKRAAAIARGEGPQASGESVVGAWDLATYRALESGSLPELDVDQADRWIWGEGIPSDIPTVDGHRVILLGKPSYERTWGAQRMFEQLPASLDAHELSRDEVDEWLAKIAAAD